MSEEKHYDVCLKGSDAAADGKQMTKAEAQKYLKELSENYAEIPENSCLFSFYAGFNTYDDMTVNLGKQWNRNNNFSEVSSGRMNIRIHIKGCSKCHQSKCINNIENGKCVDDFVCKIIVKKLFPDQYGKQR